MKKNILFIIWSFSYGGGAEKILANIVNNMDERIFNIHILEYIYGGSKMENIKPYVQVLPPILDITKPGIINKLKIKLYNKLIYICPKIIRKIYLNKKFDYEISFNYLIPSFLLDQKNKNIFAWTHGSMYDLEEKPILKKLQKKYFKKVKNIVCISDLAKESVQDLYPIYRDKIYKIENGFNFEEIYNMSDIDDMVVEDYDLIFCGRMDENKNPIRMLKIVSIIKEHIPDVRLVFMGTGDLMNNVLEEVKQRGLEKNVYVAGYNNNPYPYFKNSKVVCMTSFSEGFPTVIAEGMMLGKPFVSTNVGGVKEMSMDGLCGFIENEDTNFANRIISLLQDEKLYNKMSEQCISHIKQFSIESQINKLYDMLEGENKSNE